MRPRCRFLGLRRGWRCEFGLRGVPLTQPRSTARRGTCAPEGERKKASGGGVGRGNQPSKRDRHAVGEDHRSSPTNGPKTLPAQSNHRAEKLDAPETVRATSPDAAGTIECGGEIDQPPSSSPNGDWASQQPPRTRRCRGPAGSLQFCCSVRPPPAPERGRSASENLERSR